MVKQRYFLKPNVSSLNSVLLLYIWKCYPPILWKVNLSRLQCHYHSLLRGTSAKVREFQKCPEVLIPKTNCTLVLVYTHSSTKGTFRRDKKTPESDLWFHDGNQTNRRKPVKNGMSQKAKVRRETTCLWHPLQFRRQLLLPTPIYFKYNVHNQIINLLDLCNNSIWQAIIS